MAYVCGMEPGNEHYGARTDVEQPRDHRLGDPDEPSGAGPPYAGTPPAAVPKARTGLLMLVAFLVELVLIAAGGNQWVTDKLLRANTDLGTVAFGLRNVALTFAWRFTPRGSDPEHFWLGGILLILTTLVLSVLLIAAVVRGPVTFGRAFIGTWMAVIVATMLGGFVRGLVLDLRFSGGGGRAVQAFFGRTSPGSNVFLAGVGLGFVVALVVAALAPLTRRNPYAAGGRAPAGGAAAAYPQPGASDVALGAPAAMPWQDHHYGPPQRQGIADPDRDRTAQQPSMHKDDQADRTAQLPVADSAAERHQTPAAAPTQLAEPRREEPRRDEPPAQSSSQATTQLPRVPDDQGRFPRPPDDEDLDPEHH